MKTPPHPGGALARVPRTLEQKTDDLIRRMLRLVGRHLARLELAESRSDRRLADASTLAALARALESIERLRRMRAAHKAQT